VAKEAPALRQRATRHKWSCRTWRRTAFLQAAPEREPWWSGVIAGVALMCTYRQCPITPIAKCSPVHPASAAR